MKLYTEIKNLKEALKTNGQEKKYKQAKVWKRKYEEVMSKYSQMIIDKLKGENSDKIKQKHLNQILSNISSKPKNQKRNQFKRVITNDDDFLPN